MPPHERAIGQVSECDLVCANFFEAQASARSPRPQPQMVWQVLAAAKGAWDEVVAACRRLVVAVLADRLAFGGGLVPQGWHLVRIEAETRPQTT